MVEPDLIHSREEKRYFALGKTNMHRILVVIFAIRKTKLRVITARDANKKSSSRAIPIKLPNWLIESLKFLANKHSTSYQSLLRSYLEKEVKMELGISKPH